MGHNPLIVLPLSSQLRFDFDPESDRRPFAGYNKTVMGAERTLPPNNVVPNLKELVVTFKDTVPIIGDLRNENLKERHWEKIERVIGNPIPRDKPDEFTFGTLIDLKVRHCRQPYFCRPLLQRHCVLWPSV